MTTPLPRRRVFTPGPGFWVWLVLAAAAVVISQALRSTVSAMLLWFVLLFLPAALIYVFVGYFGLRVYVNADKTRAEKGSTLSYDVNVINPTPLCFPIVEAAVSVPQPDGVRCTAQRLVLCLFPFGNYELRHDVTFRYRGMYDIGVDCIYVTDMFHMFRIRRDEELFHTVLVFPRRLAMEKDADAAVSDDVPSAVIRPVREQSASEVGNVREYRAGDLIRSIHWKLSAKSEDFLVKEYFSDRDRSVYILCDYSGAQQPAVTETEPVKTEDKPEKEKKRMLSPDGQRLRGKEARAAKKAEREARRRARALGTLAASPDNADDSDGRFVTPAFRSEIDEYCADGIAEIAASAVVRELLAGNTCKLVWYDVRREDAPLRLVELSDLADLDAVWDDFVTTPAADSEHGVALLASRIEESMNVTVRVCTARLDDGTLDAVAAIPASLGGAGSGCHAEVLLFNPEEKYDSIYARRHFVSSCREKLREGGVAVREVHEVHASDGRGSFSFR
ncbi:MAG: DUF58 domain-containing protein [Clostridia bacterium]|nr:DUF58 domain-containing protein [Clostridia bacterium]